MNVSVFTKAGQSLDQLGTAIQEPSLDHGRNSVYLENVPFLARVSNRPCYLISYARTLWRELCSLGSRMEIARKTFVLRQRVVLPTVFPDLPRTHPLIRRYLLAHMRSIRALRTIHPWARPLDIYLLIRVIHPRLFGEDPGMVKEWPLLTPANPPHSSRCGCERGHCCGTECTARENRLASKRGAFSLRDQFRDTPHMIA